MTVSVPADASPVIAPDFDHAARQLLPDIGSALAVLDSSPDCIKLIELDGSISYMNFNGLCAMEIADFTAIKGMQWPSLWPEEARERLVGAVRAAARGEVVRFEAFCPTALGSPRWWHVTTAPVRDAQGRVTRILGISRDISELVTQREVLREAVALKDAALQRQQVLMGEIDHRVKNSFAAVIGLLRIQSRTYRGTAAEQPLGDAANRISTLARIHDQLHLDPGAEAISLRTYLRDLAHDVAGALGAQVADIALPAEDIPARPSDAAAIGQVLAELIGNAVKHGRGPASPVRIAVSLAAGPSAAGELGDGLSQAGLRLRLTIEDDGPGLPDGFDPDHGGLGMQICAIYAAQLSGRLDHGPSDLGGARFDITMTLPAAA